MIQNKPTDNQPSNIEDYVWNPIAFDYSAMYKNPNGCNSFTHQGVWVKKHPVPWWEKEE